MVLNAALSLLLAVPLPAVASAPPSPPVASPLEDGTPEAEDRPGLVRRYINQLLDDTPSQGEPQFLAYPVLAFAPETRLEVGVSSLLLFYAKRDVENRLSEVPIYVFYTLNQQYGLWLDHVIFTDDARFSFIGENRLMDFPLKYYGIGMEASYDDAVLVDARQVQIRERMLVRLWDSDFYAGPEVGLNSFSRVRFSALEGGPEPGPLPLGGQGTTNLTLGAGLVRDTRHNPLNVRDGFFGELAFLHSTDSLVSDHAFTNLFLDFRGYTSVAENVVLAGQLIGQSGVGDLPFNELGVLGGDSIMRGYYVGRYRDRTLTAAQAEVRFLPLPLGFTDRIGAAAWVAAGTVAPSPGEIDLSEVRLTAGAGLRVLTFPRSDIFSRLDFGFSEDGMGVYLYVGEAF